MYQIDIITIFPKLFDNFLETSILAKAQVKKKVRFRIHDLRDYTEDKHRSVDDTPYGGGAGMVLKPEPVITAVRAIKKEYNKGSRTRVILLSPKGIVFNQKVAKDLSQIEHIILICGRYEGFDERVLSVVDMEISIGDYVLNGGEIPAMAVAEAVVRLLPGVISKEESFKKDSFYERHLDYPHYTRPEEFERMEVPGILLSGNHKEIELWRRKEALLNTYKKRPDLLTEQELKEIKKELENG